jgi:hypothetical protein
LTVQLAAHLQNGSLPHQTIDFRDISPDIALPLQARRVHVANLAENGTLRPRPIMLAENPCDIGETVWITPIDEEFVVQEERRLEGDSRSARPLLYFLTPIHAHMIVHVTGLPHLAHGGIPIRVVRASSFQL